MTQQSGVCQGLFVVSEITASLKLICAALVILVGADPETAQEGCLPPRFDSYHGNNRRKADNEAPQSIVKICWQRMAHYHK